MKTDQMTLEEIQAERLRIHVERRAIEHSKDRDRLLLEAVS